MLYCIENSKFEYNDLLIRKSIYQPYYKRIMLVNLFNIYLKKQRTVENYEKIKKVFYRFMNYLRINIQPWIII